MEGFLLIDKPEGLTSHDVVNRVRRLTGEKRVGHAGTLDPFATGLLVVGVGRVATREFPKFMGLNKEYEATFALGATSDTDDRTGKISKSKSSNHKQFSIDNGEIFKAIKKLTGPIQQVPPAYAAIKVGGKKLYELARAGKTVERPPRPVTVYSFDVLPSQSQSPIPDHSPLITDPSSLVPHHLLFLPVHIRCSTGTYVRSLARDLGEALDIGGYVETLRRTAVGAFRVEESVPLLELPSRLTDALIPVETALSRLPHLDTVDA